MTLFQIWRLHHEVADTGRDANGRTFEQWIEAQRVVSTNAALANFERLYFTPLYRRITLSLAYFTLAHLRREMKPESRRWYAGRVEREGAPLYAPVDQDGSPARGVPSSPDLVFCARMVEHLNRQPS